MLLYIFFCSETFFVNCDLETTFSKTKKVFKIIDI
jgi:hypothetical protein